MAKSRILIVEDEGVIVMTIKNMLTRLGYEVTGIATSGADALKKTEETRPDLVLMDIVLSGDMDGIEVAEQVRSRFGIPVVYLTAYDDNKRVQRAKLTEPYGYILKPFEERDLHTTLEIALFKHMMEQKLQEREQRYRLLAENVTDVIWTTDLNLCTKYLSPSVTRLLGYSVEEALSLPGEDFLTPPSLEVVKNALAEELAVEAREHRDRSWSRALELELRCKDGSTVWTEAKVTFLRDPDGRPVGIQGVTRDITERKHAEEELYKAHKQVLDIIEFLPDATFVIDNDRKVIAWNRAIEAMTGVQKEDIIGKGDYAYAVPFYGEQRPILVDLVLSHDDEIESRYKYVKRDGNTLVAEIFLPSLYGGKGAYLWGTATPLYDSNGAIVGAIESIRDITERKKAEAALQESEEKYRSLISNINDLVMEIDSEGNFTYVSPQIFDMFGYTQEESIGLAAFDFVHPDDIEKCMKALKTMDGVKHIEYRSRHKDGHYVPVSTSGRLISDGVGGFKIVSVLRDITERRKAEEERERLIKELEAKNAEMERFVYTVSHDLRSPLVTIQGASSMLREDVALNELEKVESDLKFISDAAIKMDILLRDTLKLSRIGRVVNPPEEVPFGELIEEALELTAEQIKSNGVEITVAGNFPTVHVDRLRVVEVLVNLIGNSINYLDERSPLKIEIGFCNEGEDTVFFVRDNGIGVDKSQHEKIFELFYKVDAKREGTGVGLAIVKRIIEVHGGRIWIESEKGEGCTVCFTLPVT